MKELEKHDREAKDRGIEMMQEKQQEIELKYLGSQKPMKGHRLFEINKTTLEVSEAKMKENRTLTWHQALHVYDNPQDINLILPDEVVIEPNHAYVSALNADTALNRYKKGKGSASIPMNETMKL